MARARTFPPVVLIAAAAMCACSYRVPFGDDRAEADSGSPVTDPSNLAPNTALRWGRYECAALDGGTYPCQSIADWSSFVLDPTRRQMLMFGGGDHATARTDVAALDLGIGLWTSAYAPTACADMNPSNYDPATGSWRSTGHPVARQTYDMLVFAENTDELVLLTFNGGGGDCATPPDAATPFLTGPGSVAHYPPSAKRWTFGASLASAWPSNASAEYDPVSRTIVVLSDSGLFTYDPAARTFARHQTFANSRLGYSSQLIYFPPSDRMYSFSRDGVVFELALDRSDFALSTLAELTVTGSPAANSTGFAYDDHDRIIGGGVRDGVFYAFDPPSRTWSSRTIEVSGGVSAPVGVDFYALAYDPVRQVFVFLSGYEGDFTTWVYRY
jgi:hypothetical protein